MYSLSYQALDIRDAIKNSLPLGPGVKTSSPVYITRIDFITTHLNIPSHHIPRLASTYFPVHFTVKSLYLSNPI